MKDSKSTPSNIKELLSYDPETGIFSWRINNKRAKAGAIAGSGMPNGYIGIGIDSKIYKAHRLAWYFVYGVDPVGQIDHINGIKNDNRIINLRDSTSRDNHNNEKSHRSGRLPGASFHKVANKWRSKIDVNKKSIYLGLFNTELEAHQAYMKKRLEIGDTLWI